MINEEARAYYFASVARIHLKDFDPAAKQLRKAEQLFTKEQSQFWLGMVNAAKSRLNLARGRYAQALQFASDSGKFFAKSGSERHRVDAEIIVIETVLASGDHQRAIKLAVPLLKRRLTSHQIHNLRFLIGKCYYEKGDYSAALKEFREAVKIIEKMLKGLYPDEIRFFFVMDRYESYQLMIDCLLKLGRIKDSFMSNLKALEIINHRTIHTEKTDRKITPELIEKRNNLRAALKRLNQSTKSGQRGVERLNTYYSLEHRLWSNERKIRAVLYPHGEFGTIDLSDHKEVFKHIKSDETVINFFSSSNMIGAFCASGQKVRFIKYEIQPGEFDILLRKLHFIFENAVFGQRDVDRSYKISEHYLNIIYQKIIEPLLPYISGHHVIFVADGLFGQIPFTALRDGNGQYIKDRFTINTIVNPQDLKSRSGILRNLKSRHNAVFAVSSDLLPQIDIEARHIKSIFGRSRLFVNDRASCLNLTNELKEADGFLHIAAHASRSSENPLFSRILMNDGPFFPFDLFQSGVKAELVTLSGCQTAAPGLYYGNSFSLAKAFYQAGSHHVLATLWPVSDKLSMLFMINFYETLADVGNVYQAYQSAVNHIIGITDNPAFWGSFVLLGT
ncbi:MAG: CHAT domain-containing protein [Candidatus Zixiibacteriota bacterium]